MKEDNVAGTSYADTNSNRPEESALSSDDNTDLEALPDESAEIGKPYISLLPSPIGPAYSRPTLTVPNLISES